MTEVTSDTIHQKLRESVTRKTPEMASDALGELAQAVVVASFAAYEDPFGTTFNVPYSNEKGSFNDGTVISWLPFPDDDSGWKVMLTYTDASASPKVEGYLLIEGKTKDDDLLVKRVSHVSDADTSKIKPALALAIMGHSMINTAKQSSR